MPNKITCLQDNGQQRAVWKRLRLSHNVLFLIAPLFNLYTFIALRATPARA